MNLTTEQQDAISELGQKTATIDGLGEVRLVDCVLHETTRWGHLYRYTFWLMGAAYYQFDMEVGSGDSEIDVYETDAWQVAPKTVEVTTWEKV